MHEHKRIMISGQIHRENDDKWFPQIRDGTFVPLVWFDEVGEMKSESAQRFKVALTVRHVGQYIMYGAGAGAGLSLIAGVFSWFRG